ncbi:hypothetical protein [Rhizohabitans arisaemae]|uniref:hypothetical protein n=1 Tax=Rhizohabitans arisaemae TaxID=2720610 RepID=UPI0024B068B7|nr:hypothetical protein [Rhizohabitans arisaemae]
MDDGQLHITATTDVLADIAAGFPHGTPVLVDVEEVEPGHVPRDMRGWAVVARLVHLPLNAAGTPAGPGEPIAWGEKDAEGRQRLLYAPVLMLQSRKLAVPGRIGPVAHPADPCRRRADAAMFIGHRDEAGPYLMELVQAVAELQREVATIAVDELRRLHPAARRHLDRLSDALEHARAIADDAARFDSVCKLLELGTRSKWIYELLDEQPCDQDNLYHTLVTLPDMAWSEPTCQVHAAIVRERVPGSQLEPL